MSDSDPGKKNEVSRRGMLKWAGALAAVGVVGVGLGFGADILVRPNTTTTSVATQVSTQTQVQTKTAVSTVTAPSVPTTVTAPSVPTTVTAPGTVTTITAPGTTGTTTVTAPAPTLNYVPPLSPSVATRVEQIVSDMVALGEGEQVYRVTPSLQPTNLIKVHIKNGVFTRVEADWGDIHPNSPREDTGISKAEFISGNYQPRGAPMSYAIQAGIYAPDRILYPMMRTPGSARADLNGSFTRVTWETALDAIASKVTYVMNTYGKYSIFTAGVTPSTKSPWWTAALANTTPTDTSANLFRYTGSGVATWGHCSGANEDLSGFAIYGQPGGAFNGELGNVLNSQFIVYWGNDPAETGPIPWQSTAYYFLLAHEQGTPAIYIGPRECITANNLADQWIPIRPGTDLAMMLAVAYVLFNENLYDTAFVAKYVEPTGFAKWKSYIMGQTAGPDGAIARTPAWAAPICGVPAATIQAFAELYGQYQGYSKGKPCWLMFASGAARKYNGDLPARAAAQLQWMTGNIGISGGNLSYCHYSEYEFNSGHTGITMNYSRTAPESIPGATSTTYQAPCLIKEWKWPDAVLLRPQVQNGTMSLAAYNQIIGNISTNPAPNLKFVMLFGTGGSNFTFNDTPPIGKGILAIQQLEMYVWGGWHLTAEARAADIVLPFADFFECEGGFGALNESLGIAQCPHLLQAQGEAMPLSWVQAEIANRLGFGQYYNGLYGTNGTAATWPAVDQKALQAGFNAWNSASTATAWGLSSLPSSLSTLQSKGFLLAPSATVTTGNSNLTGVLLKQAIDTGNQTFGGVVGTPFWTPSGLAEFYCNYYAGVTGATIWGGTIDPMAIYRTQRYGMLDTTASPSYPLELIEAHPRARSNVASCDSNPLAGQSEIFRHSVWMNVADAQARGIQDNDKVEVFNEQGTIVLPAYVTSRIVPGVAYIFAGAWYNPDKNGVCQRGNDVVLMHDDYNPMHEPFNTRVDVQLYGGGD